MLVGVGKYRCGVCGFLVLLKMADCDGVCPLLNSTLFFTGIGIWWIYKKYFLPSIHVQKITNSSTSTIEPTPPIEPLKLPIIDLDLIFHRDTQPENFQKECEKIAQALREYGCAVVRDPRVKFGLNDTFLDMMERYFDLSDGVRGQESFFVIL
jgi:hypothetical protein